MSRLNFESIYGVDFSGAKLAGQNTWVARAEPTNPPFSGGRNGRAQTSPRRTVPLRLVALSRLADLCGCADRAAALAHLVRLIRASENSLWAMDFPFGLPLEVLPKRTRWPGQLDFLRDWGDDAYAVGVECCGRARKLGGPMHIRRLTDSEAKAPFDCYHYRIIYQTFHGMRDVLRPLAAPPERPSSRSSTAGSPPRRGCWSKSCPASTLKRLALPHQNYKQPAGGPLTRRRRLTRHAILEGLSRHVRFDDRFRRVMMRNPGGDALDAVIAAVGGYQGWHAADHGAVARHARYSREGRLYV